VGLLELSMFYETHTARKPLKVPVTLHSRHPVIPRRPRNGLVCCCTKFAAYGAWGWRSSFPGFVPGDFYFWPLTLRFKLDQARTKHVFTVNLTQILSAVPKIFEVQTNKQTNKSHRRR